MPGDARPYLFVTIGGRELPGLLDSGASRTMTGPRGRLLLAERGYRPRPSVNKKIQTADGTTYSVEEEMSVLMTVSDRTRRITVLLVPELPQDLILGIDFWTAMQIVPDMSRGTWTFSPNTDHVTTITTITPKEKLRNKRYRKRKDNARNDALCEPLNDTVPIDVITFPEQLHDRWYNKMTENIEANPDDYPRWKIQDNKIYKKITDRHHFPNPAYEWKLVVPNKLRPEILKQFHDEPTAGHLGVAKTYDRIKRSYYWPKMIVDVARYVHDCSVCQQTKPDNKAPQGLMGQDRTADVPWRTISADLMGPFPRSKRGRRYLLVVQDTHTKFVLLFPLRAATSKLVAQHLNDSVFMIYGVPEFLISDNGAEFTGKNVRELLAKFGVKALLNARRHSQANPTERTNLTINNMLRAYVTDKHNEWDANIAELGFALRTARSDVTNYTPAYLNYGRELKIHASEYQNVAPDTTNDHVSELIHLFTEVKDRLQKAHQDSAVRYNLRRRTNEYNIGDRVLKRKYALSNATQGYAAKLAPRYEGPFSIKRKISPIIYELAKMDGKSIGIWHISDLKTFN